MERRLNFSLDEHYHIYNRGVDRRQIFMDEGDYLRFMVLLYLSNNSEGVHFGEYRKRGLLITDLFEEDRGEPLVAIGAYCLMPNHFHLLIREIKEGGISLFVKKLLTGYSMYFNKKYERTGPLFESRFKAEHVNNDGYMQYLLAYIHLNPVKIKDPESWSGKRVQSPDTVKQYLKDYRYSSYPVYIGYKREESVILNRSVFPDYFSNPGDFEAYLSDWINFNSE